MLIYHHLAKSTLSQPKNSSTGDHLQYCYHSASCDDFGFLTREVKKFLLELKDPINNEINNL